MANTNTLMVRIKNKCDTYTNWTTKNPVLLKGEIAIVEIPANQGAVAKEPIRLMKCGDGTKKFNELEFIGGLAADVYEWAKASAKPTYTAAEISGLSDFISGAIQDTDTQYKIEVDSVDNPTTLILSSKTLGGEWTAQNTITFPKCTLAEGTENGTVKFNGTNVQVHGLDTAAYKKVTDFDASGAASTVKSELLGNSNDDYDNIVSQVTDGNYPDPTIYGVYNSLEKKITSDTQYSFEGFTITSDGTDAYGRTKNKVKLNISSNPTNLLKLNGSENAKELIAELPDLKIVKKATANDGYTASYQFMSGTKVLGDDINIPKDYLVKSVTLNKCTIKDTPITGLVVGDKYIDWVINAKEDTGNESHLYLNVDDLVGDVYKAGIGITISDDNTISLNADIGNGLMINNDKLEFDINQVTAYNELYSQVDNNTNNKADKQTTNGGFAAGNGANADSGGAIGSGASVYGAGGAVGEGAHADGAGGAVGYGTYVGDGFVGGKDAVAMFEGDPLDAIQLGTGQNQNEFSMQVYDYQLLANDATAKSATDGSKYLKDVGKLNKLTTTDKTDIVSAINEVINTDLPKKANDSDLKSIAKSGNINDLTQTEGDYIIINCGDASTLI